MTMLDPMTVFAMLIDSPRGLLELPRCHPEA
jgi:hypothetical protein